MSVSGAQRQQWIVQDFRRRRARELVALIPGGLAAYVACESFQDSAFTVRGVSGTLLLVASGAVVVAYFVHHLINWRCPACGRHFLDGFLIRRCARCGVTFK
ncbi:MAG: hypothetical protein ACJ76Y_25020 [Thermoanaerobaculia bacterium]